MDIATADTFHAERGNEAWDGTPEEKSAAIIRAQDYIEAFYRLKPDTEAHPLRVKATALLALEFISGAPALKQTAQIIKTKEDTAGALVEEFEYGDAPNDPYPMITALLRPLMIGSTGGLRKMTVVR